MLAFSLVPVASLSERWTGVQRSLSETYATQLAQLLNRLRLDAARAAEEMHGLDCRQ